MTSERTQAYGRVMRILEEAGGTKLHERERERIREAADTLVLAQSAGEAGTALADADALCEHLIATGRWSAERAAALQADLLACGPVTPV
jgi:hypothetical protein